MSEDSIISNPKFPIFHPIAPAVFSNRTESVLTGIILAFALFENKAAPQPSAKTVFARILSLLGSVCSLHLQTEPSRDNILANTVFADGCGAALFSKSAKAKLIPVCTDSVLFENTAGAMGWKIGNFGFEMMLSSEIPKMILEAAAPRI